MKIGCTPVTIYAKERVKPKNRPLLLLQLTLITFWNFFLFTLPSHLYSNDHMTMTYSACSHFISMQTLAPFNLA